MKSLPRKWKISPELETGRRGVCWHLLSFNKSFTSGHESAGFAFCFVANDSLALFDCMPGCVSRTELKNTCQRNLDSSFCPRIAFLSQLT